MNQVHKFLKKHQKVTGIVVCSALILGGLSGGLVYHDNQVKAEEVAKAQIQANKVKTEKENEAKPQKEVTDLLSKATTEPSDTNIKAVQTALTKVTNIAFVTKTETAIKDIQSRLNLINSAKSAVAEYQKDATSTTAQDKALKESLQAKFNESNRQAQEASKVAQATAQEQQKATQKSSSNSNTTSKSSNSTSSNSTKSNANNNTGWVNNDGSSSGSSSNKSNSSSNSSSSSSSSSGSSNYKYNGAYGNSKEAQDKLTQAERDTSKNNVEDWMGYK